MPRSVDAQQVYDLIYKKGDVIPGYDRYWRYAADVKTIDAPLNYLSSKEDTYWGVREVLSGIGAADRFDIKILEIGSGLGYLTYSLRKAGYSACGLDISETAVELAKSNYGDFFVAGDLFKFAEQNVGAYDVVIFTEVIEHVDSPVKFVEAALRLLKSGGKAIVTTPNKSLYPADFIWESDLPPIHCWWFSESSMSYIAGKLGAKMDLVDFSRFYRAFTYLDFNVLRKNQSPKSIFDEHGTLQVVGNTRTKSKLRSWLAGNPVLKRVYFTLKVSMSGDIVRLKNRSFTLCAIFRKDTQE